MTPSILVVDDEVSFRSVMVELLTDAGYVVAGAESAETALSMADQCRYQIIFSDLRMPGMDGIAFVGEIKKRDPDTEVIMMTSHTSVSSAIEALRLGAYDYLIKPIDDVGLVLALVKRVTEKLLLEEEKKELLQDLQKKNRELEESQRKVLQYSMDIAALYAAEKEILAGLDLAEVYQRAAACLSKLVGLRPAVLWSVSEKSRELAPAAQSGLEGVDPQAWKVRLSNPVVPPDWSIPSELKEALAAKAGAGSALFHPIFGRQELFGILALFDPKREAFTKREMEILSRFSSSVAIAVENARLYENVKRLAIRDGLTGLYNRRRFEETLAAEISRASRHKQAVSLIFIDVDHFKNYNDSQGHIMGDEVLRQVGGLIQKRVRVTDTACRYGGEEFTILLPCTDKNSARRLAEDIRARVAAYPFPFRELQPGGAVTVSLGIAEYPSDAETEEGLVKFADAALYRAKQGGRNRVSD